MSKINGVSRKDIIKSLNWCAAKDCGGCVFRHYTRCLRELIVHACELVNKQHDEINELRKHKHGLTHTRLYSIWKCMRQRCLSKQHKDYKDYGGRGISICDEWGDFRTFYDWAMKNGYSDDLTIDRINNNGNYCPENCRWSDKYVQSRNRRFTTLTRSGETHTIDEWSKIIGVSNSCIRYRIRKGMPIDQILSPKEKGGCRE